FFFQAEDGIRDFHVTGVQTCALPILGEIGYALATGLLGGGALNARQLLVVNMLTDVLPAIAIAVRPPMHVTPEQLLAEGPEASRSGARRVGDECGALR